MKRDLLWCWSPYGDASHVVKEFMGQARPFSPAGEVYRGSYW